MNGWEWRDHRRAAGLTLRQLAHAAGTSETNLAAYERGTKIPNKATVCRISTLLAAGPDSPIFTQRAMTSASLAAAIRREIKTGGSLSDRLRLVRQFTTSAQRLVSPADREAMFAGPSTTGDPRWDALVAGVVEGLAIKTGEPPPPWTADKRLDSFWFVNSMPELHAYSFAHTPISLQVRGVILDEADLESV